MLASSLIVDDLSGRIVGGIIILAGMTPLVMRRARPVSLLLLLAGTTWTISISAGSLSTQFLHRVLLAAAVTVAASPVFAPARRWSTWSAVLLLAGFGAACAVPGWASQRGVTAVLWTAVLLRTTAVVWPSPRRVRVAPALLAQIVMLVIASLGQRLSWINADERRIAYDVAAALAALLIARSAADPLGPDITLDDRRTASWAVGVRAPGADQFIGADGRPLVSADGRHSIEFTLDELGTAVLVHDDPAFDDPRVRERLHDAVRLLAERSALLRRIELQRQDVDASRQRLVEADRTASLAMVDDLDRTVRPHLDHVARALAATPATGDRRAEHLLREISDEVLALSTGVTPADLSDGLHTALARLVERSTVPARLTAEAIDLDHEASMTLFMVASEVVANVAKHSGADRLEVELARHGHDVVLRCADDGRGGADLRPGGGLEHVGRRLTDLRGHLEITQRAGGGTVVTAHLPLVDLHHG